MYSLWPDLKNDIEKLLLKLDAGQTGYFFGYRVHPIHKTRQFHNGLDIPKTNGTPICLPWDGIVVKAWFDPKVADGGFGGGNSLVIRHPQMDLVYHSTGYCHLQTFSSNAVAGRVLKTGTIIGYVDTTGDSTGSHLHFVLRQAINGTVQAVDPLPELLKACGICEMPIHPVG